MRRDKEHTLARVEVERPSTYMMLSIVLEEDKLLFKSTLSIIEKLRQSTKIDSAPLIKATLPLFKFIPRP